MKPKTIILIVADCLRPDHLSCYGYQRETSHYIDELANEGVVFTRAYSQSTWTRPVAASLLTGLYPGVHGVQIDGDALPDNIATLPGVLRPHGFHSALFSAIGQVSHYTNLHKDFDENYPLYWSETKSIRMTRADVVVREFCQWFDRHLDEKTFSLLWFADTHYPYYVPGKKAKFSESAVDFTGVPPGSYGQDRELLHRRMDGYDDSINYVDYSIGNLIQFLKSRNRYADSMIFILADHGEVFNEHRRFDLFPFLRRFQRNRYSTLGHFHVFPYEELLRVPMIVKFPGGRHTGECCQPVQIIDIPATISESLGMNFRTQGTDLVSSLRASDTSHQRHVLAEYWGRDRYVKCSALLNSSYKYVRYSYAHSIRNLLNSMLCSKKRRNILREIAKRVAFLLTPGEYLLSIEDESTQKNLIPSEPSLHRNMLEYMDNILEGNQRLRMELGAVSRKMDTDRGIEEHLRNLGYLD